MKSATCCYCGTHTILTLGGKVGNTTRHELKCSTCGAPISRMKALRTDHTRDPFTVQGKRGQKPSHVSIYGKQAPPQRPQRKKTKKKKSFAKRFFDIAEDVLEEAFDIFD